MRVPFSWIKEYIDWPGTVEELAELLTMSGTEVEGIDWVGAPRDPENLSCFVVGKVLTREQHPNADKLSMCTVEVGKVIGGVTVGDSPAWLKARLTHAGMRPISNVVDVTNYVMLGWGQPLHAFDAGKIRGGKLIARRATDGEKIVTLDGVERTLDDQMLVIADAGRPLVIAGVFGSVDAEVDEGTTDLVLEAASFSGPSILRTELHTGIRSEASNRFEKGLDANLVPGGLDFASRLFAELCGGTVAPGTVDVWGEASSRPRLSYRPAKADALLGYAVPAAEQAGILRRLECEVDE